MSSWSGASHSASGSVKASTPVSPAPSARSISARQRTDFDASRTGTARAPEVTDTIMLCQGERAILDTTFRYPGDFMFHAHQSEFAELGWMGLFRAGEVRRDT